MVGTHNKPSSCNNRAASLGDFSAQVAANRLTVRRLAELAEHYGPDGFQRQCADLQAYARALAEHLPALSVKRAPADLDTDPPALDTFTTAGVIGPTGTTGAEYSDVAPNTAHPAPSEQLVTVAVTVRFSPC